MKLFTLQADLALNTTGFDSGVQRASEKITSLRGNLNGMASDAEDTKRRFDIALGTAIGDFIGKLAGAMTEAVFEWTSDGILLASSMEETNSKINTIFGDGADAIHKWAQTTRESFGIGELTAKNYAAQVAGLLSGDSKNLTSKEIQEVSTSLVGLAADMASFHNMSFDDAFGKLISGLKGQTEAIDDLGIDLRVANLAEAFGMSQKEWSGLDQRTRLLNTYQYIMKETAVAQGDFARTSDSYANQLRILDENINSLKLALGESILPVVTELVTWFNSLFGSQENATKGAEKLAEAYTDSIVDIESTTTNALALVTALEGLASSAENASSTELWNSILSELSKTLPGLSSLINANTGEIEGGTNALRSYIEQWRTTQKELARMKTMEDMFNMADTMEAEIAKLQMQQQVAQIRKAGAKEGMGSLGNDLLSYMLAGMTKMGASEADIKAMQLFGASGASNLLARLAAGGNTNAVMGALLQGGDIWKNKSFMDYFIAGGGNAEQLSMMAQLYAAQKETYDKYNIDNSEEIKERSDALNNLQEEINIMNDILNAEEKKTAEREAAGKKDSDADSTPIAEATAALQTVTESLTTLKADVIAATKEGSMAGCQAGVGSISVTGNVSTGNVMLNTGGLVGLLAPKLNLRLGVRNEIR